MLNKLLVVLLILIASSFACDPVVGTQTVATQNVEPTASSVKVSSNASDMNLARKAMENWKAIVADKPQWLSEWNEFRFWYNHNWIQIDRDEALAIDESGEMSERQNIFLLMRWLVADGRIDDAVAVADRHFSKAPIARVLPSVVFGDSEQNFWADVAQHGVRTKDRSLIELAGRRVENLAAREPKPEGRPPAPSADTVTARFFVAASRLELDRLEAVGNDRIRESINDLRRATGGMLIDNVGMIYHETLAYSQLESWQMLDEEPGVTFVPTIDNKALQQLKEMDDLKVYWSYELPELEDQVVLHWVVRQIHQKRLAPLISYLMRANGNQLVRAKFLGLVAAGIAKENPDHAGKLRNAVAAMVGNEQATGGKYETMAMEIEATVELAIAFEAADMHESAVNWMEKSIGLFNRYQHDFDSSQKHDSYTSVLAGASAIGFVRKDLPESLVKWTDDFSAMNERRSLEKFWIYDKRNRLVDLTRIAVRKTPPLEWHRDSGHPSVVEFFQLRNTHQWLPLTNHIEKTNPDDSSHQLFKISEFSIQQIGFKATLDWTADIENQGTKMKLEMNAIFQAVNPQYANPLQPEVGSDRFAPPIPWPLRGC